MRSVIFVSFSTVISGNTSLKASFIGFKILKRPFHEFLIASMVISLPPAFFHPSRREFLFSADLAIISPKYSDKLVHNFLPSSKSPTSISQV